MFLWFIATAMAAMWFTFRDPAIDHRVVVLGAVLPDGLDAAVSIAYRADGGTVAAGLAHSIAAPVVLLLVIMLATLGRRPARRRWLMLPIGMFWHLVFDGAWASPDLFVWPFGGGELYEFSIPFTQRAVISNLIFEAVALVILAWLWRTWGLGDKKRRTLFISSGRLDSELPSLRQ